MKLPDDWDTPGADNARLCERFDRACFEHQGRILPYRFFVPEKSKERAERYPLVLYLHGADAIGKDNELPLTMHDVGTMFVRETWQSTHPCYVLAPQYKHRMHWATQGMPEMLHSFLESFLKAYDDIDRSRIYMYGYSAGGIGTLRMIKTYPHYFAGALVICGATQGDEMEKLYDTPLWLFHAADDLIVPIGDKCFTPQDFGYCGSRPLYALLSKEMGESVRFTEYKKGELKKKYGINPHCAWVPVAEDEAAKEWLFSQRENPPA